MCRDVKDRNDAFASLACTDATDGEAKKNMSVTTGHSLKRRAGKVNTCLTCRARWRASLKASFIPPPALEDGGATLL